MLKRKLIIAGLLVTSVATAFSAVGQNSTVHACNTLGECNKEINDAKTQREALQQEVDRVKAAATSTEQELHALKLQVDAYIAQIDTATKTIADLKTQSEKLEKSMKETEALLKKRLLEMQLSFETDKNLNFIADSSSITEMIDRAQAITELTKSDKELIRRYDVQNKEVIRNREETEKAKAELEALKSAKDKLIQENSAKLDEYRKRQAEIDKAIDSARQVEQLSSDQIQKIKDAAARVPVYSGGGASGSGERASFDGGFPLKHATMTASFGESEYHSVPHNGTDYAPIGDPTVYSMVDGVVVLNTYNGARGWMVAIAFQDARGWKTLMYQHLAGQSSAGSAGTPVKKGQAVGTAGNTGMSFGVHLHAEVSVAGAGPSWISRGAAAESGQTAIESYFGLPSSW